MREIEVLGEATVTLLADRRVFAPYGLSGGGSGAAGRAVWLAGAQGETELAGKCSVPMAPGDRVQVETPDGSGWGEAKT